MSAVRKEGTTREMVSVIAETFAGVTSRAPAGRLTKVDRQLNMIDETQHDMQSVMQEKQEKVENGGCV